MCVSCNVIIMKFNSSRQRPKINKKLEFVTQRLQRLGQDLVELNAMWLHRQNEALGVLSEKRTECAELLT